MAWLVHVLTCAFGLGSWVAVNGLWVELPLIVNTLPEAWTLPSYLTVIIQMANIGPLLVTIIYKLLPGRLKESWVNYIILSVGVVACVLLAFFWDKTTTVAGERHSTAFFIITFFLALVDCTSSVTFLPFMMRFPAKYVTTYYIGEGLSGFVPGLIGLAQGVGISTCVNSSQTAGNQTEGWTLQTQYLSPNFSTQGFFFFLAAMMCVSLLAFIALNRLPQTYSLSAENLVPTAAASVSFGLDNPGKDTEEDSGECNTKVAAQSGGSLAGPEHTVLQLAFIYAMEVWTNAATNGLLSSVQTYSCMPYGNVAYHLSATLSLMANPLACTVAMFVQNRSLVFLGLLTLVGSGFGSYNMAMAVLSPCPLLQGSVGGEIVIVLSWLLFTGTLTYVKVMVGLILRDRSHSALVLCGAAGQLGSMIGSLTMFPLVNVYSLFKSGDMCNTVCPQ